MTCHPPLLFCMLQIHFFDQTRNFGSLDISSVWDMLISTINTIVSASGSSALGGGGGLEADTSISLGWGSLDMPSISARAKWWCQCDFLFEDPKFRVYVQKWRMRVYNEGYYWYISFKYQKPCSFPLLPCTSISGLVPSIISLFLEVYSEIHLPPGFALHSFVQPKSEKKSNTHQKTHI